MYIDLCNKIKEMKDEELEKKLNLDVIVSGGAICTPSLYRLMSETLKCTYTAVSIFYLITLIVNKLLLLFINCV